MINILRETKLWQIPPSAHKKALADNFLYELQKYLWGLKGEPRKDMYSSICYKSYTSFISLSCTRTMCSNCLKPTTSKSTDEICATNSKLLLIKTKWILANHKYKLEHHFIGVNGRMYALLKRNKKCHCKN